MEDCAPPFYPDLPNMAGLDFGTDNIAALACTDGSSVVCKGGAVLSENRLFAKNKADSVSLLTQGKVHAHAESKHLTRLSLQHYCRQHDMMHKISCRIIEWCIEHRVGVLVIGTNKFWKQNRIAIPPNLMSPQTILSLFMDMLKGNHRFLAGESAEDGIRLIAGGLIINADCNGSANILRKAVPHAWAGKTDFRFLAAPYSITYQRLQKGLA